MKYAYDYQNQYTRGWVRAEFDPGFGDMLIDVGMAKLALEDTAGGWANGTDLRLVQIADDGTETFPPVTAKGSRGPLPNNR